MSNHHSKSRNASQLRQDIDRGRTGDKVDAAADPAVAPLGTDEEAAGTPPSPGEVDQSLRQEHRRVDNSAAKGGRRTWVTLAVLALLLTIALATIANWIG